MALPFSPIQHGSDVEQLLLVMFFTACICESVACVVWNPVCRDDTHGHLHAASTVWDCWNSCLSTGMCFRFDWNDNAADGKRCLIFDGTPDIIRSVFTRECFSNGNNWNLYHFRFQLIKRSVGQMSIHYKGSVLWNQIPQVLQVPMCK